MYRAGVALTICSAVALAAIVAALLVEPELLRGSRPSSAAGRAQTTSGSLAPSQLIAAMAAAESVLATGELTATHEYGGGVSTSTRLRFDLGGGQREPRLHSVTTYRGGEVQTVERLTIGSTSWQRQPDGSWSPQPSRQAVEQEVRALLPQADAIRSAVMTRAADHVALRWHDAQRDADLTLLVDPATGIPRELSQAHAATGEELTVVYGAWNASITIPGPGEPDTPQDQLPPVQAGRPG